MINFLACYSVYENKKEKKFIEKVKSELENTLSQEINLIIPKSYQEEIQILEKKDNDIDIYYANPLNAFQKYKEGYEAFARRKKNTFFLIGNLKEDSDYILVSVPYFESYFLPIFLIKEVDLLRPQVIYVNTQEEAYKEVLYRKADISLISKDVYKNLSKKYEPINIIKEINTNIPNYIMVKKSLSRYIDKSLKKFFRKISSREFEKITKFNFSIEDIKKIKLFFDISKSVYENEYIGTLIYRDKILYASKTTEIISGFSLRELKMSTVLDFLDIDDQIKEKIKENVERRKRGEQFLEFYPSVKIRTKDGTTKYLKVFSKTIMFNNQYSGLVVFTDITREIRYEKLYKALRNINQAITSVLTEEELYQTVCDTLVKELDIKFAWVGVPDKKTNTIKTLYKCGDEDDYLEKIKIAVGKNIPEAKGPTGKAVSEGKISINPNTEENPLMEPWRKEMIKRDFLSSAAIPIIKDGKPIATLNIYASEPYFFEEETKSLLEELQYDLSFAVSKIDTIRTSIILSKAIEKSTEWVLITDETGKILYINDFVSKITGYSKEEIIGKNPRIFKSGYHSEYFYKKLWETITSGKEFEAIFINRKKNGETFYLEEKIIPVELPGGIVRYVSIGKDITKEKFLSEENEKLKYYDILTGLYNYNGFAAQIEEYISKEKKPAALLLVDITNFSFINKTYGSSVGDKILKEVGNVIRRNIGIKDIAGRISGDEFGVFLTKLNNKSEIFVVIENISNELKKGIFVDEKNIKVKIRGGVTIYPDDGTNFQTLLENASITLKLSKEKKEENIINVFNKNIEKQAKIYIQTGNLVEKAINKNLFIFYYQPYFDSVTGKIAGLEALLRILDENNQIHYPNEFIEFLEKSSYLDAFRDWALKEVTSKIKKWKKPISLNISARTFKNPQFPEEVLKHADNLPETLVIEITERLYMDDIKKSKDIIKKIKECKKVKIAIDDFGTGYSSLAYLKDIDADILKIDISFVREILKDNKSKAIVKNIIKLAKDLEMKTVAEGVETKEQLEILKEMNVDYVQGFLLSKPLDENTIEQILK